MQPSDFDAFGAELARLVDAIPSSKAFTPSQVGTWFEALEDLELDQIRAAVRRVIQTATFVPSIGQLRSMILGDPNDRAVLAWDRLITAVRYHGPYASVDFQDPVLHTCIEAMGGWPTVASIEANPETLGYRQHEFVQHYRAYQHRLPGPARAYLPGLFEITNGDSRATWDHAHDHADEVVRVSEDGKGTLAKRKVLPPGRVPALEDVSQGKEHVAVTADRVLPGVVPDAPLTLERIKATVSELAERFGTPEQIRREELLLKAARSREAPPALKSDLGRAMDETLTNEQAKESRHG